LAAQHLERLGYELLERNFRCTLGEIDLVLRDGEMLVFTEVRTRRGTAFGTPEESVTLKKQERLIKLAEAYLQVRQLPPTPWRIDVVAVEIAPNGRLLRVEHYPNAVFR
jgi:putative endonuclease